MANFDLTAQQVLDLLSQMGHSIPDLVQNLQQLTNPQPEYWFVGLTSSSLSLTRALTADPTQSLIELQDFLVLLT